jgi:hypothetical protein
MARQSHWTGPDMEIHTIVGVFDNEAQAQRAVDRLVEWGFTRDNVHIAPSAAVSEPATASPATSPADTQAHSETLHTGVSSLFHRLFGGTAGLEDVDYYCEAVRHGSVVVTVVSGSDEGADSAADILNEYGALDIEVHARYLRDSGWQSSPAPSSMPSAASGAAVSNEQVIAGESNENTGRRNKGGVRIYTRSAERAVK